MVDEISQSTRAPFEPSEFKKPISLDQESVVHDGHAFIKINHEDFLKNDSTTAQTVKADAVHYTAIPSDLALLSSAADLQKTSFSILPVNEDTLSQSATSSGKESAEESIRDLPKTDHVDGALLLSKKTEQPLDLQKLAALKTDVVADHHLKTPAAEAKKSDVTSKTMAALPKTANDTETESKSSIRPLTQGAVKQVWVDDHVPDKVFYTALAGNKAAEKELIDEIKTAQNILQKLNKAVLYDLLANEVMPLKLSNDAMIIGYLSAFDSVKALKTEIDAATAPHKEIPTEDLLKLKQYFSAAKNSGRIEKAVARGQNLALDIRIVDDKQKINGLFTVETLKADGDLEKLIRSNQCKPEQLVDCASQILNGMADLHAAGYVHGDIKPENVLYSIKNGKISVMISDWGKAEIAHTKPTIHKGNTRFAPWENRLSMTGDVCSTGIKLIRLFEQQVLAHKRLSDHTLRSLIEPKEKGAFIAANSHEKKGKVREGFEVFVIEGKCFNAIEANHTRTQTFWGLTTQAKNMAVATSKDSLKKIEAEKDRYIDALVAGMTEMKLADPYALDELGRLLKGMTDIDPNSRPTMRQAAARFAIVQEMLAER